MGVEILVNKVRVSVAMITYNGELFLKEQLDSILCQLTKEDELVISDDGSLDNTVAIIQEYQKKYCNIRFLTGPKKGIKKNVEHVLRNCQGEYIFLADQDDIWKSNKIERIMELFRKTDASLMIHDAIVFCEDLQNPILDSFFSFRGSKSGVIKNIIKNSYMGCCMAFSRELIDKILPIPNNIEMHDQWIGILNDYFLKKSYFCQEPLLYYRRHQENNSQMQHYSFLRMVRNRGCFFCQFIVRVFSIRCKKGEHMIE